MVEVTWTNQSIEDIRSIAEFIAKDSSKYANLQLDLKIFQQQEELFQKQTLKIFVS